ncbi:MAG TPA: hypothetical protein VI197_29535 [Polyangiaceae bacterium]
MTRPSATLPHRTPPAEPLNAPAASEAAFLLLFDAPTLASVGHAFDTLVRELASGCARVLGFSPTVAWAALPPPRLGLRPSADAGMAEGCLEELVGRGVSTLFVLPVSFDFGLEQKQWLSELVRAARRARPELAVHYDAMNTSHPLLLQAFIDSAARKLAEMQLGAPNDLGLLLIANGAGDPDTRSDSYKLMRLVWEQLGASKGEVAFVRHPTLPLPERLSACARSGLTWLCVAQFLWSAEQLDYARVIFRDCVAQFEVSGWRLTDEIADHPNVRAWLEQRMLELYRERRARLRTRVPSAKRAPDPVGRVYRRDGSTPIADWDPHDASSRLGDTLLARIGAASELGPLLHAFGLDAERCLVKPTWHGYARGTYSDPVALDALLTAASPHALLLEGHTASKNSGDRGFDWETESEAERVWIREQEQLYLEKTGIKSVLHRHGAGFLNVTECWWDGHCAPPERVRELLLERGVELRFEELLAYVPAALLELQGAPLVSFARFKGPTRLAISNLFGLLPEPLRSAWHGPNITYFASVCCDLAKLYGTLFRLHGLVESLSFAVRWDRKGLYRSRWGNYDLVESPRVVCLGSSLAATDVLAARLQGQDVRRSAFFDVVRAELGYPAELESVELPSELVQLFV